MAKESFSCFLLGVAEDASSLLRAWDTLCGSYDEALEAVFKIGTSFYKGFLGL